MKRLLRRLFALRQIPSGIIKPLDYQLTSDYLAGGGVVGGGGGGGGALLDYEPTWPSYETSLLHDSLLAQRLANRKARLIPGVPTTYQAAEYASRYGPAATTRHAGRRPNHDVIPQSIDISSELRSIIIMMEISISRLYECSTYNIITVRHPAKTHTNNTDRQTAHKNKRTHKH